MRIQSLTLYTNRLAEQHYFFTKLMGFEQLEESETGFGVKVGSTELRFVEASIRGRYHYCFLIPNNQLDAAIKWLREREISILKIEGDRIVQYFADWNADSVYFLDGAGNLLEFIVRYDLEHDSPGPFTPEQIINVNEIGMSSSDPAKLNTQLTERIGPKFWKGDLERFGTFGSPLGLLLLVHTRAKPNWFPTDIPTLPLPFEAELVADGKTYPMTYEKEELFI